MKTVLRWIGFFLALVFLILTFINASWLAPGPRGQVKLIAQRGVGQLAVPSSGDCAAARIEPPVHAFLENTVASIQEATRNGAAMIALDVAATSDGQMVLFGDETLDCRTDGQGAPGARTLAQLKALDAGYGYTADGGKTFPLRGTGIGAIPTVQEAVRAADTKPLVYRFMSDDAKEANLLAAALKAAGRDPVALGDGFFGGGAPVARIRQLFPKAWAFSHAEAEACSSCYRRSGWLGIVPDACKGGTLFVPLNRTWLYAGWPNRLIARMEEAGARIIVTAPQGDDDTAPTGLDLPEQIREIPVGYNGFVWVDDIWALGPALHPQYGRRNPAVDEKYEAQLEARRKARE